MAVPCADERTHALGVRVVAAAAEINRLFPSEQSKLRDRESLSHGRDHRVQLGSRRWTDSEGRLSAAAARRQAVVACGLPAEGQLSMIPSYFNRQSLKNWRNRDQSLMLLISSIKLFRDFSLARCYRFMVASFSAILALLLSTAPWSTKCSPLLPTNERFTI